MENNKQGKKEKYKCCICNTWIISYGHNPCPMKERGRCCRDCNRKVIEERIRSIKGY